MSVKGNLASKHNAKSIHATQGKKDTCDKCRKQSNYFYECGCKQKPKFCKGCSVGQDIQKKCSKCKKKFDRYNPPLTIVHDIKIINNTYSKSSTTTTKMEKTYSNNHYKRKIEVTQHQKKIQNNNKVNKPQKDVNGKRVQYDITVQKRQQIINQLMKKSFQNQYGEGFYNKIGDRNEYFPRQGRNQIGQQFQREYEKQRQFYPQSQQNSYQYQTKNYQPLNQYRQRLQFTSQKKQFSNEREKINVIDTKNIYSIDKNTQKILTKEHQLKQIKYEIQTNKGYLDTKCQIIYKLYQLAKSIDKTDKWSNKITFPDCRCTQSKQFVESLVKDQCLICAKKCQFQFQKYQLQNGFCICNDCEVLFKYKEEDEKKYIEPLFFKCLTCSDYKQIKKSKKQIHNNQNKIDGQIMVCNDCFQTSIKGQRQIQKHKQNQKKIQQEERKRQEERRRKQEERQRVQLQNQRKRQEIQRKNKQIMDRFQQQNFKRQLKQIQQMQQRQKRQKQQKERIRRQQEQQKSNKKIQIARQNQKQQKMNQLMESIKKQDEKYKKQQSIRRVFASQDKYTKPYQTRRCIACEQILTYYQKGTQIDGAYMCSRCTTMNKRQFRHKQFIANISQVRNIPNKNIQSPNRMMNRMMTQDYKLNLKKENQNKREVIKIEDKNQQKLQLNKLNNFYQETISKKAKTQKFDNFISQKKISNLQKNILDNQSEKQIVRKSVNYENERQKVQQIAKNDYGLNKPDSNSKDMINKSKQQKMQTPKKTQQQSKSPYQSKQQRNQQNKIQVPVKIICSLCQISIKTIQDLGVKNQQNLITCKKCYQNQKLVINNKSSFIGRSSQNLKSNQQFISSPFRRDSQSIIDPTVIQNSKQQNTQKTLDQKNNFLNFKQHQQQNRMQISFNQSQLVNMKSFQGNDSLEQQKTQKQKYQRLKLQNYQYKPLRNYQVQQKQQQESVNYYRKVPEYSDVLTPSLKSNSVYYKMKQVPLSQIKIKQEQKISQKQSQKSQQNKKHSNDSSMKQSPLLSKSLNKITLKPQRDNSHLNQSGHSLTIELKRKSEEQQKKPFDVAISEIPKKSLNDQKQAIQNPLQATSIELHNLLNSQKQKTHNQQQKIIKENQPILNEKLQIALGNELDEKIGKEQFLCTGCQFMIENSKAFCISQGQKNMKQEEKMYMCLICYNSQYLEMKKAEQISRRSKISDSRSLYGSKQKSRVSNIKSQTFNSSTLRKDMKSQNKKTYQRQDPFQISSKPINQSSIKQAISNKYYPSTPGIDKGIFDNNDKKFLENRLQKNSTIPSNNFMNHYAEQDLKKEENQKIQNKTQNQKIHEVKNSPIKPSFQKTDQKPKIEILSNSQSSKETDNLTKILQNEKQVKKQEKLSCQICRRQNSILCFGKICLDCFKKQKLSS